MKSSYITRTSKGGFAAAAQDGSYQPISKKSYKLLGIVYILSTWYTRSQFGQNPMQKQLIDKPKLKSSK